jgi:hypothetical protein
LITDTSTAKNQEEFRKLNVIPVIASSLSTRNEAFLSFLTAFTLELVKDNEKIQKAAIIAGFVPPIMNIIQFSTNALAIFNALGIVWIISRRNGE